jgi:hypothetical protein
MAHAFTQYAHWLAVLTPVTITIAMRIGQIATPAEKAPIWRPSCRLAPFAPWWPRRSGGHFDQTTASIGRRNSGS